MNLEYKLFLISDFKKMSTLPGNSILFIFVLFFFFFLEQMVIRICFLQNHRITEW